MPSTNPQKPPDSFVSSSERTPLLSGPTSTAASPSAPPAPGSASGAGFTPDGYHQSHHDADSPTASDTDSATIDPSDTPNHPIGPFRATAIIFSLWLFIFTQGMPHSYTRLLTILTLLAATNLSGMSMLQGYIADELDAHDQVIWLTTSFLIPMSSFAPVAGRLATIFEPRSLVPPIAFGLTVGTLICALAKSFTVFIVGRVFAGIGAAGVLTLAIITVLELTTSKQRGFFIGLVNAGMTLGVSFGAIVYGALMPVVGWVSFHLTTIRSHTGYSLTVSAAPTLRIPGTSRRHRRSILVLQSPQDYEITGRQEYLNLAKGKAH